MLETDESIGEAPTVCQAHVGTAAPAVRRPRITGPLPLCQRHGYPQNASGTGTEEQFLPLSTCALVTRKNKLTYCTWIILPFGSSVPCTRTFFPSNFFTSSW